jgi:hypothetical protein
MWTIEKFHGGRFQAAIGPYTQYNVAHHHAAELRRYHGRNGWSYAVVMESTRDPMHEPADRRDQAPKLLRLNSRRPGT